MDPHQLVLAFGVGALVGLSSGAFGKGGSALATPLLAAAGVPPILAVASPLPATVPATAFAGRVYARSGLVDGRIVRIGICVGLPLTVAGALLTRWIPGAPLVVVSEFVVLLLAVRMLLARGTTPDVIVGAGSEPSRTRIAVTVAAVAFVSGLLANSGGILLAPLFVTVLGLPLKRALGTSLAVSLVLALPGTVVHALLGHIAWPLTFAFGLASVPFARLGAHLSLRAPSRALARAYGIALAVTVGSTLMLSR
jgi:uncharacterized membrane protein YfcA